MCFTKKTRVIGYAPRTLIKYHLHSGRVRVLGFKMGNHRTIFEIISFMPTSFIVYTNNNQSNDTIKLGQRMHRLLNMGLIKN